MSDSVTVATWNTEWSTPKSERGQRVSTVLRDVAADVLVVTEGNRGLLPAGGFAVDAGADWGYAPKAERRKVLVWSKRRLAVEVTGEEGAARGRLVVTTTDTPIGPVRVVAVCIPWASAHVSTGRSDATQWSEHLQYLEQLAVLLPAFDDGMPTVIAGDFNQRIPRFRQPLRVAAALTEVFADWRVHTAGDMEDGPHIDHIASNALLTCLNVGEWPGRDAVGRLSDHSGVSCRFART